MKSFQKVTPANLSNGEAEIIRERYINNTCALFTHHHQLCLHILSMTLNVIPTPLPQYSDQHLVRKPQLLKLYAERQKAGGKKRRFQVY